MPKRDSAPIGAPCWVDLFTSDPDKGRAFYEELFGWTSEDAGEEYGGYVNFSKDGRLVETLKPEKRIYNASGQTMTIAAIDIGLLGDRYVSLGEPVGAGGAQNIAGAWALRIYIKPFIDWIWAGAFLMALGGFMAVSDRRYRLAVRRKTRVAWGEVRGSAPAD